MLSSQDINGIVSNAAAVQLPAGRLKRVLVEPYINGIDEEGLHIRLIVSDDDPIVDDGAAIADLMLDVADRLFEAGEQRTPLVDFASEEELAHSGDPDA